MESDLELAAALRPVLLRLNNLIRRQVPSAALTTAQSAALATILDQGPLRMGDLAAREQVRVPTMTVAVQRMEELGLVRRWRDPADGRAVLVGLTDTGRKRLARVTYKRNVLFADMLAGLDDDQHAAIAAAVPVLAAMLAGNPVSAGRPASSERLAT